MADTAPPPAPSKPPPTFTLAEVLKFLERASELTGKNLSEVLDKIDPRLVSKGT